MHFDIPFEEWCVVLRRRRRGNKFHVLTERAEQRPDHLQTLAAVRRFPHASDRLAELGQVKSKGSRCTFRTQRVYDAQERNPNKES